MDRKVLTATATPLASIFGSGFLVIVPVLNGAVGSWAPAAMAVVCVLAYAISVCLYVRILVAFVLGGSARIPLGENS